jgi:hypothetical protein
VYDVVLFSTKRVGRAQILCERLYALYASSHTPRAAHGDSVAVSVSSKQGEMEHWMMKHAALALGISSEATLFFRLYALFIFVCITTSSIRVLHFSGIASLLEHRQNVSLSVGYLFDVLARSARVISYVIMHVLSYR